MNMQHTSLAIRLTIVSVATMLVTACETPPPPPAPAPPPPPPPQVAPVPAAPVSRAAAIEVGTVAPETAVGRAFAEGLDLYEKGDYSAAITKLTDPAIDSAWPELRMRALKYLAFSYCVSGKPALCQQTFYSAKQAYPDFNLTKAEQGHPTWGPIFDKAKVGPPDKSVVNKEMLRKSPKPNRRP